MKFLDKYNPKDNPIVIKCEARETQPIDNLIIFQGKLKKLTNSNRDRLATSIMKKGFIAPFFVWFNDGDYKLLDGTQRLTTLIWLRQKGWDIPMLPVAFVEADNEEDARSKLLAITSQYGDFEMEALTDWMQAVDKEMAEAIRLVDGELKLDFDISIDDDIDGSEGDDEDMVIEISKPGDEWKIGYHTVICGEENLYYCDAMVMRYVVWCNKNNVNPRVLLNGEEFDPSGLK